MMSVLIVIAVLTYAIKVAFTDGCYAVRGKVPPRIRARMAQAARAGDGHRARYGFGDYFSDLWDYAFTALRARQQRKLANPRYGARKYLADRWMHAWEDLATKHDQARAARLEGTDLVRDPGRLGRLTAKIRRFTRRNGDTQRITVKPANTPTPTARPAGTAPAAPATPAPSPAAAPTRPASPTGGAPDNGGRLALVIPIHSREESAMSNTTGTGEITGLATAQQYAAGMAGAFSSQSANTEQFMANLTANQVTGEAVTAAAQAQELTNAAAAAWASAQDALHRHTQVAEAYAANPDAGSREFVTSE